MKQTPECIAFDWLISNSSSKDAYDVERWKLKESCHAHNTESGCYYYLFELDLFRKVRKCLENVNVK